MARHKIQKNCNPVLRDRDALYDLHHRQGLGSPIIATKIGSHTSTVLDAIHRFNIPHPAYYPYKGVNARRRSAAQAIEGNRKLTSDGYIKVYRNGKWVREHRYIIEQELGRSLLRSEPVHHINGDRADNRRENLLLVSQMEHNIRTKLCASCSLRKEVHLLRRRVKELTKQLQLKWDLTNN